MFFNYFQKLIKKSVDVVFPIECVNCGRAETFLCTNCLNKIKIIPVQICHYCHKPQAFGQTCAECLNKNRLDGLFILNPYREPILREAIHIWKYERVKAVGDILGSYIAENLAKRHFPVLPNTIITAIPLHSKKQFDRGFNQSEQIAKIIAQVFNLTFKTLLIKTKNTKSQFSLSKEDRLNNIKNVYQYNQKEKLENNIILIDDISTTGATLEEAGKVLKKSGATSIWAIALAHGS